METYSSEGDQILETIQKADKFNAWMYDQIKPWLRADILEIGSGIGTFSEMIARDFDNKIILSDIDKKYVEKLEEKFKDKKNVTARKLDLNKKEDFKGLKNIGSCFALNVMEHVEKDIDAMNHIYDILEEGGRFVILVPAHKALYNTLDKAVGHHRRYNKKEMRKRVAKTKFKIKKMFYFNAPSILGWFITGNVLKKKTLGSGSMKLFNKLVPIIRPIEKYVLRKKIGISLIAVLEK